MVKNNAVTDQEKREKKIVVKKLAEMEEELKVIRLNLNIYILSLFLLSASCAVRKPHRPGTNLEIVYHDY